MSKVTYITNRVTTVRKTVGNATGKNATPQSHASIVLEIVGPADSDHVMIEGVMPRALALALGARIFSPA